MSIEEALAKLTATVEVNNSLLERVVAGQHAVLEKVEAPKPTRTRAKKDEPAPEPAADEGNAASDPVATESPAVDAKTASEPAAPAATAEDLKVTASGWLGGTTDQAERKNRGEFLMAMTQHFGSPKLTGPEATLDAEQIKQAVFFVRRKAAGLAVDFGAEYDFDGDPAQDAAAPADDFDALG